VAAITVIPTALFAQMGGAPLIPASTLGALLTPALPFAARRRARYPWPGFGDLAFAEQARSRKHTMAATKQHR
jgi:hypothetical protein